MSKTKVQIIESERGWGQRVDETKEFESYESAETYCREYNRKHNPPVASTVSAPDWYMYAHIVDAKPEHQFGMLR